MITLRQLEFALAVAKHRHFKRAAEECNISQSALSLGIAELEKQLDTQIFERNNKQVLITPIGEEILVRAQRVFSEINDLTTRAQSHQTPLAYPMTVGMIPTIAPYLLPKVLPELKAQYPNFRMTVVEQQTERLLEQVRYGHIDTAIIALPYPVDGLHTFEFWQEDFFAVFPSDDSLADLKTISSDQLSTANLMLLGEGHCLTDQALNVCSFDRDEFKSNFSDASLNTLIQMALAGMGTTLIPEMALQQVRRQNNDVATIPLTEKGPHRRIAFVTRLNYARVDDVNLLATIFKKALEADQQ
ncbi:hydrogen peroxide-inducible genes activator [Psychrobacter sanguinis]|uniref:hydrogen peroxide-inducible genes activator n=1 Tax=Psychrobacter sanguinis TaxID=861445 RepID=UPI0019194BC1|nr:hydrogen peroxide-inducible genes activator [Psychrobacter sanguinis]MCC3309331.1 hydrogen peroxide-inducible genes activator [Psychrobacter sanguinis]MCC3345457.1 hydrogen peroxide-inducible genes activator [Psychrobacter sanguinis]MDY3305208.1 hydrogen peroxide-inducible genes activator [Psychrobacter sanguinis]UEC26602.1 hydrogen peroxide-inducible genes activator [Psychrobacter sanguinis]